MATLNDGLLAFYNDLQEPGAARRHAGADLLGVRPPHHARTAATAPITAPRRVMLAMGGRCNGGLYGTAPNLNPDPANPTLENSAGDVTIRNRLPLGLRAGHRQLARRRFGRRPRRKLQEGVARFRLTQSLKSSVMAAAISSAASSSHRRF